MKKLTLTLIQVLVAINHDALCENSDGFMSEFVDKFPHLPVKNNGNRGITGRMLLEAKGITGLSSTELKKYTASKVIPSIT